MYKKTLNGAASYKLSQNNSPDSGDSGDFVAFLQVIDSDKIETSFASMFGNKISLMLQMAGFVSMVTVWGIKLGLV